MHLSAPRKKSLVNLTPLIDVVFILLIFFMLASNFIQWHYIELSVGDASDIDIDYEKISIISINSDKSYSLNQQALPLDSIIAKVREQRILEVAVDVEACTHVVHILQHVLVEVDLLCGVDLEKHILLAADGIHLNMDGRDIAVDNT